MQPSLVAFFENILYNQYKSDSNPQSLRKTDVSGVSPTIQEYRKEKVEMTQIKVKKRSGENCKLMVDKIEQMFYPVTRTNVHFELYDKTYMYYYKIKL